MSITHKVEENIRARIGAIRAQIIEKVQALNVLTPEELQQLNQMQIEVNERKSTYSSYVGLVLGLPKTTEVKEDESKLGPIAALEKLDSKTLHDIIARAVLSAGDKALDVFPYIASSKYVCEILKAQGAGLPGLEEVVNDHRLADKDASPKASEKPVPVVRKEAIGADGRHTPLTIGLELKDGLTVKQVLEAMHHMHKELPGKAMAAAAVR